MKLAPFWPQADAETKLNWPRWLRLSQVRLTSIDSQGAHYKVTFRDGSYDMQTFTRDVVDAALERRECDDAWYGFVHAQLSIPDHFREQRVKFEQTYNDGKYARKRCAHWKKGSLLGFFGDMGCSEGLIYDTERFQEHGPTYFEINEHRHIWVKPEAISSWRDVDRF